MKNIIASSGVMNAKFGTSGGLDNHMWNSNLKRSIFSSLDNVFRASKAVRTKCQSDDSLAYINGNGQNVEFIESNDENSKLGSTNDVETNGSKVEEGHEEEEREEEAPSLDELRELCQKARKELEVARINSTMFEEKAQKISEAAIALKDEAENAWNDVNSTMDAIQETVDAEVVAKEALQKATMSLSFAEARLQVVVESLEVAKRESDTDEVLGDQETESDIKKEEEALLDAQEHIKKCQENLSHCEAELQHLQIKKDELQKKVDRLNKIAEQAQLDALKAEEDVANIMLLAEQAVAFEVEATQRVNDAEIALQKAEKSLSYSQADALDTAQEQVSGDETAGDEKVGKVSVGDPNAERERDLLIDGDSVTGDLSAEGSFDKAVQTFEDSYLSDNQSDQENGKLDLEYKEDMEAEKSKNVVQTKKQDTQKDLTKDSSASAPKKSVKKSSRFFSASFFSNSADESEFTPASFFEGLLESGKKQLPKLVLGLILFGAGYALLLLYLCFSHCCAVFLFPLSLSLILLSWFSY